MDYSEQLAELQTGVNELIAVSAEIEGILIFFAVVILFYFCCKFIAMFF